jgi:hypothetical protein
MYKKIIENNYIIAIGTGIVGDEITESEYNELRGIIRTAPLAPGGYTYKLRADNLEWELVELPPTPDEPITDDEALTRYANKLTNGNAENIQEATETLIKQLKEDK